MKKNKPGRTIKERVKTGRKGQVPSPSRRSERKKALPDSGGPLESILLSAMDAIITLDQDQRVLLFNAAAEKMFGYTAAEVVGQSLDRLIPERFRDGHQSHIRTFGRTNASTRHMGRLGTIYGLRASGVEFPLEAAISQCTVGGEKVFSVILRDITERKSAEEQLRRTERLAELGTLASGMAHEIGTPMNVILGRAELLMGKTEEPSTKKGLQTIITQVERITKIMNQLLTFARRRKAEVRPIDVKRTIEDSLDVLQERIRRSRIKVETELDSSLPSVQADPDQMAQVFLNLFINAIHAMPEGGILRLGLSRAGGEVKMTIADTGHGIPTENLPKIFTPFFTTKEVGKGTGLGLTVVHGILQEHHGAISVESKPGEGTIFTITLPTYVEP